MIKKILISSLLKKTLYVFTPLQPGLKPGEAKFLNFQINEVSGTVTDFTLNKGVTFGFVIKSNGCMGKFSTKGDKYRDDFVRPKIGQNRR